MLQKSTDDTKFEPFFESTDYIKTTNDIPNIKPEISEDIEVKINAGTFTLYKVQVYNDFIAQSNHTVDKKEKKSQNSDTVVQILNFYLEYEKIDNKKPDSPKELSNGYVVINISTNNYSLKLAFGINNRKQFSMFMDHLKRYCVKKSLLDEYSIDKALGQGGFSYVYLCLHKKTKKKYAVKVIKRNSLENKKAYKYLQNEVNIMRILDHDNIVRTYEIHDQGHYIAILQDYVEGPSQAEYIKNMTNKITEQMALNWTHDLLRCLRYFHSLNYVHRDLKPGNIMLAKQPTKGTMGKDGRKSSLNEQYKVILIDFGLAADFTDKSANSFMMDRSGTVGYLAPELINKNNSNFNEKLDIFSLGIVLIEMIQRKNPFKTAVYKDSMINNYNCKIQWSSLPVSNECRLFLKQITAASPKDRLNCDEALEHTIFTIIDPTINFSIDLAEEMKRLSNYTTIIKTKIQCDFDAKSVVGEVEYIMPDREDLDSEFLKSGGSGDFNFSQTIRYPDDNQSVLANSFIAFKKKFDGNNSCSKSIQYNESRLFALDMDDNMSIRSRKSVSPMDKKKILLRRKTQGLSPNIAKSNLDAGQGLNIEVGHIDEDDRKCKTPVIGKKFEFKRAMTTNKKRLSMTPTPNKTFHRKSSLFSSRFKDELSDAEPISEENKNDAESEQQENVSNAASHENPAKELIQNYIK